MTEITITDFVLDDINQRRLCGSSPTILIIGGRGKGKSTVAKAIMRALQDVPSGVVFSGTESSNQFYSEIVPPLFTFDSFDKHALNNIVKAQKKSDKSNDVFVLLDDMMYDPGFLRQSLMRSIFLNGRHYRITLMVTTQYAIDVPCALRGNVDYVFLMRENNLQTIQKLFKNFGGMFPNHNIFNQALRACTEGFGSLVIDNTKEAVGKFRVDMDEEKKKFRMFSPSVWRFAENRTLEKECDVVEQADCRIIMSQ